MMAAGTSDFFFFAVLKHMLCKQADPDSQDIWGKQIFEVQISELSGLCSSVISDFLEYQDQIFCIV